MEGSKEQFKEFISFIRKNCLDKFTNEFFASIENGKIPQKLNFTVEQLEKDKLFEEINELFLDLTKQKAVLLELLPKFTTDISDCLNIVKAIDELFTQYQGYSLKMLAKAFKESKEQLSESFLKRESLNKELEALSYSISHDLRAPLRSIDGFSLALIEDFEEKLDEEGKDYLKRIRDASQKMSDLIDDLLNLSRISKREMLIEPVNLSEISNEIINEFKELEPGRKTDIVINKELIVSGDKLLLRIVLDNLFGNAWKFTKNEYTIIEFGSFSDNHNSNQKVYFIRDNGVGFDMKYTNKLFGTFQKLHNINEFPGSGIGLATVQRIIRKHGGNVWAESEENKGSVFFFTLNT